MSRKIKTFWKSRIRWIRSYLIVVFAITLVLLAYSLVVVSQVRKNAEANNQLLANYCATVIEKDLNSLQDYSTTLLYSEKTKKMHSFNEHTAFSRESMKIAYDLIYDMRFYSVTNEMVDKIYVFYPALDLIIGKNGVFSSYVYFKSENVSVQSLEDEYAFWMDTLFLEENSGFHTYTDLNGEHCVYYCQDAIREADDSNRRVVVATINTDYLCDAIEKAVPPSIFRFVGFVDEDSRIFAEAGKDSQFIKNGDTFQLPETSKNIIMYSVKSDVWPLQFVMVQDLHSAYKIVYFTSVILSVGLVATLIVGLSVGFFYAKKNKEAVGQITKRFPKQVDLRRQNDYEYIQKEIDELLIANKNAILAAEQQQKLINSFFLNELLSRKNLTETDVERICAIYQISFECAQFAIVVAKENGEQRITEKQIHEIVAEFVDDSFSVFWTQQSEKYVFLVNYDSFTKCTNEAVRIFAGQIQQQCGCEVDVSTTVESVSQIVRIWERFGNVKQSGAEKDLDGEESFAEQPIFRVFEDAVDRDDYLSAELLVPQICRSIAMLKNANLSLCRKHAILVKLYEKNCNEQIRVQLDSLMITDGTESLEKELCSILKGLDRDINNRIDIRQIPELVHDLISRDYHNPQLGLQMLADQFGISTSYLSRVFKKKYGTSVLRYLNYYRIEQAKQLMMEGNESLKEIALKVGFSSDVNLIRVFKSFENTTPGSYRNSGGTINKSSKA